MTPLLLAPGPTPLLLTAPRIHKRRSPKPRHIISVGGGIASSLILPLWVTQHYPQDEVVMVMARLPNEDPDVFRLVETVAGMLGLDLEYIGTHRHPFDTFYQARFLGNSMADPCSRLLKREVIADWLACHYEPQDTMYVGVGAYEAHRWEAIYQRWHKSGVTVKMPLMEEPQWTHETQMAYCQDTLGFVPRLYRYGFSHNNCGGACIKAGQREWARLLWYLPDVYEWWEEEEGKFRTWIGQDVTILRDRHAGQSFPVTLAAFRERM